MALGQPNRSLKKFKNYHSRQNKVTRSSYRSYSTRCFQSLLLLEISTTPHQHIYTCTAWWTSNWLTKKLTVSLLSGILHSIVQAFHVTWSLSRFWWGHLRMADRKSLHIQCNTVHKVSFKLNLLLILNDVGRKSWNCLQEHWQV